MPEQQKAIRAAIDRWLSNDTGADYDDLARMIEDALPECPDCEGVGSHSVKRESPLPPRSGSSS